MPLDGRALLIISAISVVACSEVSGLGDFAIAGGGHKNGGAGSGGSGGNGGSGGAGAGGGGGGGGGMAGSAIALDGVDDYVRFADTDAFTSASGFTWELWFNASAPPTDGNLGRVQTLFSALEDTICEDVYLGFGGDQVPARELAFVVDGDGECTSRDMDPVRHAPVGGFEANRWYHVAAVADYGNSEVRLYLDGQGVDMRADLGDPLPQDMVVRLGRWDNGMASEAYFGGRMDELRVYEAPLAANRIAEHYAAGAGQHGVPQEPNVVGGWHCNEGTGQEAFDYVADQSGYFEGGTSWAPGHVVPP